MKSPSNSERANSGRANLAVDGDGARRWFARLLWRAFPAASEHAVAERAAEALGVSARQARHWLRGEHDASLRYVVAVCLIAGVELALDGAGRPPRRDG